MSDEDVFLEAAQAAAFAAADEAFKAAVAAGKPRIICNLEAGEAFSRVAILAEVCAGAQDAP